MCIILFYFISLHILYLHSIESAFVAVVILQLHLLHAGDKIPELKSLKIALILETDMLEWVTKIQVYEKEREDKEKGSAIDE